MTSSPDPVAGAIFDFVDTGSYPTDTSLVSSPLTSSTLESLGQLLSKARSEVQDSIRELSALSAPDIDGWIAQAKQLQVDRDTSIAQAEEIERLHGEYGELQAKQRDAQAQAKLLEGEVSFTAGLREALEAVKSTKETIAVGREHLEGGKLTEAVRATKDAQSRLESDTVGSLRGTLAVDLLRHRIEEQRQAVTEEVVKTWSHLITANDDRTGITIEQQEGKLSLSSVVEALDDLDLLDSKVAGLNSLINDIIIQPRLEPGSGPLRAIAIDGQRAFCQAIPSRDPSIKRLLIEILALSKYLKTSLPPSADTTLSKMMMPHIQKVLLQDVLRKSVPPDLYGISQFKEILAEVASFAKELNTFGWQDTTQLTAWVENAPQVWLRVRSASSLDSLRQMLKRGLGNPRSVERVETQTIVEGDEILAANGNAEDWNAEWDENAEDVQQSDHAALALDGATASAAAAVTASGEEEEEEEDASGWGWDEEGEEGRPIEEQPQEQPESKSQTEPDDDDGGAEAWDWDADAADGGGEEGAAGAQANVAGLSQSQKQVASTTPLQQANGLPQNVAPVKKTITLRESYHITALPEQILDLLTMVVEDADSLSRATEASNPVAQAGPSLYALPGTLLAMFRAAAPIAYGSNDSGNMYIYNDSQYLSEQLRSFSEHHASRSPDQDTLVLQPDISALEIFGKRSYSREMEAQRRILGDLLDGASGFASCTEEPYAGQCDLAIMSVIDRIRQVHAQWQSVLSPSALLQAIGSLLSTIVSKIIVDIEDISDIGEAESQRLTGYCTSISSLEDIFLPELPEGADDGGDSRVPSTAVYVPSWLKFQYLANILESSLVDIKYLWTEGGLSLEYSADEVVDLIEALFADSSRRKEAINAIRRG